MVAREGRGQGEAPCGKWRQEPLQVAVPWAGGDKGAGGGPVIWSQVRKSGMERSHL